MRETSDTSQMAETLELFPLETFQSATLPGNHTRVIDATVARY